mgnify:CR=1 FL=1
MDQKRSKEATIQLPYSGELPAVSPRAKQPQKCDRKLFAIKGYQNY